jgi:hypothetical protein
MRLIRTVIAGLAAASGSGCFTAPVGPGLFTARPSMPDWFYYHGARNFIQKPIVHCDEKEFVKYVRKRAEEAWAEVCHSAATPYSRDYAQGFIEGFVDYVEAGGTGEPPYLPPLCYRLTKNRTPDGHQAADDWYAGFRHGAAVARGTGLRELNYVPLPGPATPLETNHRDAAVLPPSSGSAPGSVPVMPPPVRPVPPELLPQPRQQMPVPVPPGAAGPAAPPVPFPASVGKGPSPWPGTSVVRGPTPWPTAWPATASTRPAAAPASSVALVPVAATAPAPVAGPRPGTPLQPVAPVAPAAKPVSSPAWSAASAAPNAKPAPTQQGAAARPKPIVLVEHSAPAGEAPTVAPPAPAAPSASEFSPWQPAPKPKPPIVVRDP